MQIVDNFVLVMSTITWIFLNGEGGKSFECALSKGGHPNACRMRAGGGRGQKRQKNCVRTLCMAPSRM